MKLKNNKGFTLVELLAVIVILGIIMAIAVPAVSSYINKSRKDAWISSANNFINAVRNKALAGKFSLPVELNEVTVVSLDMIDVDSGKFQSAYDADYVINKSYVIIVNGNTRSNPIYQFYFAAQDTKGNYIPLTLEKDLSSKSVKSNASNTAPVSIQSLSGTETGLSKDLFCEVDNQDCEWDTGTPKSYIVGLKLPAGFTNWVAMIYSKA